MRTCNTETCRWGQLDIPSRPECVPTVRQVVRRLAAQAGLGRAEAEDLDLAVTEACGNAIRHGSPNHARSIIYVTFYTAPGCVAVEVRDEGLGFDPSTKQRPEPGAMADGGYGLHIMRQVADVVEISSRDGTVVRLVKRHRPADGPEPVRPGEAARRRGRLEAALAV